MLHKWSHQLPQFTAVLLVTLLRMPLNQETWGLCPTYICHGPLGLFIGATPPPVSPQSALLPAILPFQGQHYALHTEFHKFPVFLFLQPVQEAALPWSILAGPSVWWHQLIWWVSSIASSTWLTKIQRSQDRPPWGSASHQPPGRTEPINHQSLNGISDPVCCRAMISDVPWQHWGRCGGVNQFKAGRVATS